MNTTVTGTSNPSKPYHVQVRKDIVYGVGAVGACNGREAILRELKLDLYQPILGAPTHNRPVLVMAFGGAFHRGSKEDDAYGNAPQRNNSVAWYCHEFARRGYVACSIDYRLVPEDPQPGNTPVTFSPKNFPRSRVDVVRKIMGLSKASDDMLWRGVEAASDDMALALRYIKAQSAEWGINPQRLAIGGFSAGARTALNVAFGEREPVAAVIALSGYMDAQDIERHLALGQSFPPLLLISAENDLDYVARHTPDMVARFRAHGLHCEHVQVNGATHFYPANAPAVHDSRGLTTVECAMVAFLEHAMPG